MNSATLEFEATMCETTVNSNTSDNSQEHKMNCRLIDNPLQWQAIANTWDNAFCNPMQSYAWLSAWWKHFHSNSAARLAIVVVCENDRDIAFAPFFVQRTSIGNTLKLLGSGEACSDYLDIGITPEFANSHQEEVSKAIANHIRSANFKKQFGIIDCIEFEGYSTNQKSIVQLIEQLQIDGTSVETVELEGCWLTKFPDSWKEYELSISKSRRRKVRKALKWEAENTIALSKTETPQQLKDAWPEVVRLHQLRREMLGQPGCFADSEFEGFLLEAFGQLTEQKRAFIAQLHDCTQDNKTIAVVLLLKQFDCWQIYQSGADPSAMGLEPGHSLNTLILKDNFESGPKALDFLRGDEPYKEGWAAERITLYRTRVFGTHLSARLRFQALRARRQWKQWSELIKSKFLNGAEK